jgi:hypothetical protein
MNRPLFALLLPLLVLLVPACGDDAPASPESFKLTVAVTDQAGDPVPGLDMSLVQDTPYYQDGKSRPASAEPGRPAVTIPFTLDQESDVRLSIEDIEGHQVRLLGEQSLPAGTHHWVWNGLGDAEQRLPSGVYTVRLVVHLAGQEPIIHEQTRPMLMAMIDPGRYSVGTTDQDGRIVLTDRKLFPFLYDQPDIAAVDENGEMIGEIRFTPAMRFGLADLTGGGSMRFIEDVTGSGTLNFTWVTPGKSEARSEVDPFPGRNDVDPVPGANQLNQPFPVPFN